MTTTLDELEALEKAARGGPWIAYGNAVCGGVDGDYAVADCHGPGLLGQQEDAALIAAARNALPALIAACRAAGEVVAYTGCPSSPSHTGEPRCGVCVFCRLDAALAALLMRP